MTKLKIFGMGLLVALAIAAIAFCSNALDLGLFSFFAPKYESVRRQTFEQSQSYNEGMLRDLENIQAQYLEATTDAQRAALRATAIHRFEVYPIDRLPPDLRNFYAGLKNGQ